MITQVPADVLRYVVMPYLAIKDACAGYAATLIDIGVMANCVYIEPHGIKSTVQIRVGYENNEPIYSPATVHYRNGSQHRIDGPAIECLNGYKWWVQYNETHRIGGPAVELSDGERHWLVYTGCVVSNRRPGELVCRWS